MTAFSVPTLPNVSPMVKSKRSDSSTTWMTPLMIQAGMQTAQIHPFVITLERRVTDRSGAATGLALSAMALVSLLSGCGTG